MARAIASNALTVLIVLLAVAAGVIAWGQRQFAGPGPLETGICLRVPTGASMAGVSEDLANRGAISSDTVFRLGVAYTDRGADLKAGSFLIAAGESMDGIVSAITASGRSTCGTDINYRIGVITAEMVVRELDPETQQYVELMRYAPFTEQAPDALSEIMSKPSTQYRVTLAEGVTSWQVAESLKLAPFMNGEISEVPAEGALAPDSYEVATLADRATILGQMETRQSAILSDLWAARQEGLPIATPEEALTLASIVEKETGVPEERAEVASVFVNRLDQGMRLQTDPTVIYGLTEGKAPLGRGLRQSELRRQTPYNTYVIRGLPPTPIANPGRDSIRAALNPEESDYLFFVADGTGGHAFATTLAEHNENVKRWRTIEAERASQ